MLTVDNLVRKGYLHDHVVPPLNTVTLADHLYDLPSNPEDKFWKTPSSYSRCSKHSAPKRGHSRRTLAVPNPQHQIPLCLKLVEHWSEIEAFCEKSKLSLSTPTVKENSERAVDRSSYFRDLSAERILRSSGCRFHLYADFARYYSSIYTHSIAWALHGKEAARKDERTQKLAGNQIDPLVRATQDRQSVGIPVGPDTSLVIAEIIATSIDQEIQAAPITQGLRYVDDFHLYFRSRGDCERAIAALHAACRQYELDINDTKTLIEELPDFSEPPWKNVLRASSFNDKTVSATDLLSYFNAAFQLSQAHPFDGVLKYAVSRSAGFTNDDFQLYESLLCRCMIAEPSCLPDVLRILRETKREVFLHQEPLILTLEELCRYHAPLQHGYEVAWAVWFAVEFGLRLSEEIAAVVSKVEDDSVALVSLHARERNLMDPDPTIIWRSWLTKEQLNLEHWLAAYELSVKGWLTPPDGGDFIADHPFFSALRDLSISFYDRAADGPGDELLPVA
jgi:Reverse transcriptase (RNA-dependent DNA polymerase)